MYLSHLCNVLGFSWFLVKRIIACVLGGIVGAFAFVYIASLVAVAPIQLPAIIVLETSGEWYWWLLYVVYMIPLLVFLVAAVVELYAKYCADKPLTKQD